MHEAPLPLAAGETLRLRVLLDRSSVEVFAQDGRAVLTAASTRTRRAWASPSRPGAAAPASWACARDGSGGGAAHAARPRPHVRAPTHFFGFITAIICFAASRSIRTNDANCWPESSASAPSIVTSSPVW